MQQTATQRRIERAGMIERLWRTASLVLAAAVLALSTVSCHGNVGVASASFQLGLEESRLTVQLAPRAYRAQYLGATMWERAEAVLVGPDGSRHETSATGVSMGPVTSATLVFGGVAPGVGYALEVRLLRRDSQGQWGQAATWQRSGIELLPGSNELEMDGAVGQAVTPPPQRVLGAYVTSLPGYGVRSRLLSPRDIVTTARGVSYIADGPYIRRLSRDSSGRVLLTTVVGGDGYADGVGAQARFQIIVGLAVAADDTIYALEQHGLIRKIVIDEEGLATVSTVAGMPQAGYVDGDGLVARFSGPTAIAAAPGGALYVADAGNRRVRKVVFDAQGRSTVSTIAGTGASGNQDGPGDVARFGSLRGMAVDAQGRLFVSDLNRIRLIVENEGGAVTVSTFAGGVSSGGADGPALAATFIGPDGLCFDGSGDVLVAEAGGHRIRRIKQGAGGAQVSTVAGNGVAGSTDGPLAEARLNGVSRLALDRDGNILAGERSEARIRQVALSGARVSTVAGDGRVELLDGLGEAPLFTLPDGMALGPNGEVYFADFDACQIWKIAVDGRYVLVAGDGVRGHRNGPGSQARFNSPCGMVTDRSGALYVGEQGNHVIRKLTFDAQGLATVTTFAGTGAVGSLDGPAASATFESPVWMTWDPDGNLLVNDNYQSRIRKISFGPQGEGIVTTLAGFAGSGHLDGPVEFAKLNAPNGLAVAADGRIFFTENYYRLRMLAKDSQGKWHVTTLAGGPEGYSDGPGGQARFGVLGGVVIAEPGKLYVADASNNRIRQVDVDPLGNAYVTTLAGSSAGFSDGPLAQARFNFPIVIQLSVDRCLYVQDRNNRVVRKITFQK